MKNRIFKLPTTVKVGLGGLLLYSIGCANEYINPTTRTQPLVPETPASAPVEPKAEPKEQPAPSQEESIETEVKVGYKISNKRAYDDLCSILDKRLDAFEQIQFVESMDSAPEGKDNISLDELANAFDTKMKPEALQLSHSEKIYAEEAQKEEIAQEVENAYKALKTMTESIKFIEGLRAQEHSELQVATELKIGYQVSNKQAFESLCKLIEEKNGKAPDDFEKICLAERIDSDKDGTVTTQDIMKEYDRLAKEGTTVEYAQPIPLAPEQQRTIGSLLRLKVQKMAQKERIAYMQDLRTAKEQPSAPQLPTLPKAPPAAPNPTPGKYKEINVPVQYGFDQNGANRFEQICKFESRSDPYQRIQFAASLDANKDGTLNSDECVGHIRAKFKQGKKEYMELTSKVPPKVDAENLAALTEKVKVEEGLVDRFNKWLNGKNNMYERAKFLEMKKENPALYATIDNTTMTALEQKEFK